MRFDNQTNLAAKLFFGGLGERDGTRRALATVIARESFRVQPNRQLERLEPWPVLEQSLQSEHGRFAPDGYPFCRGTDLVVTGTARTPPTTSLPISVRLGHHFDQLLLFGDRRWEQRRFRGLQPSEPAPFTEMTVDWSRAYGGVSHSGEQQHAHPLNPDGRGFALDAAAAEGRALANIEDPRALVESWSDRPMPACWGPVDNAPQWQVAAGLSEGRQPEEIVTDVAAVSIRSAPPRNVVADVTEGARLQIVFGDNLLSAVLPAGPSMMAEVGTRRVDRPLEHAGVWVLLDERILVVSYRARLAYELRRGEQRSVTLCPAQQEPHSTGSRSTGQKGGRDGASMSAH